MLEFSSRPPEDPRGVALALVRTPSSAPLVAIVTCENLVGTYTHFWKGRTLPHDHDNCQACQAGMPYRWHAWLSALTHKTHEHILFECTAQAAEIFTLYHKANGTLRGALFEAHRPSRKPNGRVHIRIKTIDLSAIVLPDAPDLVACLSILWNLSTNDLPVPCHFKDAPAIAAADKNTQDPLKENTNGNRFTHATH